MARSGCCRTRMLISGFFLSTLYAYAQTERHCTAGLKTPGYTEPHGDILIEQGNALDIICILNDKYMHEHGENSSKNLYFMRDAEPIPSEMIEILNSSSIRLHVDNPPASNSMYTCKLRNDSGAVCLNSVIVGTKPLPIDDFKCIGYNYENLTCTWTRPDNYVKTNYNLTYYFPGRASRLLLHVCPKYTLYEDGKTMSCLWTVLSNPQYRQAQRTFFFQLNITNIFGTTILNKTFSHFPNVLSGPPENLTYVNITTESIYLYWSLPSAMKAFPPGLQHRVMYQSEYGEKHWQFGGLVRTKGSTNDVYFNLTGLTYAHALYDIRVSLRSDAAEPDDESMWSKNSSITIRTMSKIPGDSPKTNIGSFEIVSAGNSLNTTDMYVYWQQIQEEIKNGEDFSYYIMVVGKSRTIEPVEMRNAYAKFTNLSIAESYTFHIWSQNKAGRSLEESTVFVPKQSERIGEPLSFTKIAFGNGKYELSWEPPKPRPFYDAPLKNYTIFWCTHDRDRPYQCSGYLDWVEIPNDKTVYNITVSEDKINQFAISANSETSSSGMVWATCTVIHNKAIGKMENVWIIHVASTYIEVGWKLDCSDRIGSVKGFVIYYCSIVKPTVTSCKGPEQNYTIYGDSSTNRANITGLKPYETYMLAVAVMTKLTAQSQKSTYLFGTTLEEAPSSPQNVQVVNVTSSSITLIWQKPIVTNGKLKNYMITFNNTTTDINANFEEYTINNLMSYVDYKIYVVACTVKCSAPSKVQMVTTKGGSPSKISQPGVSFQNDSYIVVEWEQPVYPRGNTDIYEVNFKEKLQYENRTAAVINVTGTPRYVIEDCGGDGRYNTFYISVRAVNIFDGIRYEGPWSDELESYCRTSPNLWIWMLIPVCFVLVLALFYMAKKMYIHCQAMRDVEVKLPSGLAPVVATDISLSHWGGPKLPEEQDRRPSGDEELLLVKMSDTRTLSGDSSGCSSGHESVTSSLESATHLSSTSDSGTEQPRSSSTEDLRKNSLRLRNVASTRPVKGYITMPTDNVNPTSWGPKSAVPGSYCVLGVDPTPITSISPTYVPVSVPQQELTKSPYVLPDASNQSSPYVVTGDLNKPSNSGYVPFNTADAIIDKNPSYVMAGNKGLVIPNLMRLDSVQSTELEDKPVYVQVADPSSNMRKVTPDSFSRHQPSIDTTTAKTGYVSIGDALPPTACTDPSKGYIPHRHFDAKTLKED